MGDLHLPAYPPIYPISKVVKPRQRKAKMPDWGTEQRATIGQNQTAPEWTVRWILTPIQANTLDAFLAERAKKGEWFLWTAPGTTQSRYRCDDWLHTFYDYKWRQFQASFRQVYSYNLPSMAAGTGYFVLSGTNTGFFRGYISRHDTGVFTLTGNAPALAETRPIYADTGAFVLTGTGITVARSWRLTADAGAFVLIGNDTALVEVEQLFAAPAAFALTGADVSFSIGGGPPPPSTTDESSFWSDWAFTGSDTFLYEEGAATPPPSTTDESSFWSDWAFTSSDTFLYEEGAAAATDEVSFWSTWQDWIEESALLLE
jgi:phage-related protein